MKIRAGPARPVAQPISRAPRGHDRSTPYVRYRRRKVNAAVRQVTQPGREPAAQTLSRAPFAALFSAHGYGQFPPDLEQFAVAAGRYRDVSEVLAGCVELLRRAEAEVAAFVRTLKDAQAEADREGCRDAEDVHREMAAMLDGMVHARP